MTIHFPSLLTTRLRVIGLALVATLLIAVDASAQIEPDQQERITLSPSSTTLRVDAGETKRESMTVINDGDVAYGFSVYARPYSVANELYEPDFTNPKSNTDVYTWVQFDQTNYRIEPGQQVEVNYTVRVPADATPGGHYGVLFAETAERGLEGTGVARKKRVGNLLYVTVNGDFAVSGAFKGFNLPFWQTTAPIVSTARIENTGNADFRTTINTTAKDLFGRTKFSYTGDPIVLPATTRLAEMPWENAPSFGIFKVSQSVEFLDQKHQNNGFVLIAPVWFPFVFIVVIIGGVVHAVLKRRRTRR